MREILFRGKRIDNGEWVEGAFCLKDCDDPFGDMVDRPSIIKYDPPCDGFWFRIDPETVGQFTGLTDKNGKKVFEGDIIEWFAQGESEHPDFGYIEYDEQSFAWRVCWQKYDPDWLEGMQSQYITVIGNVFDNKDLLS